MGKKRIKKIFEPFLNRCLSENGVKMSENMSNLVNFPNLQKAIKKPEVFVTKGFRTVWVRRFELPAS